MKRIAIFGVPRSGTSWLSQILNSCPDVAMRFQPLFSYGHKGKLSENSTLEDIYSFFDEILLSNDPFALQKTKHHKNYPVFNKSALPTHIAFKEVRYLNIIENLLISKVDIKIIGIVRNPLSVLASWTKAPKEFDPSWNLMSEWRYATLKNDNRPEEFYGFEKWKDSTINFINYKKKYPNKFLLVKYSDLIEDTIKTTKKVFKFCQLKLDEQVIQFIDASKSRFDFDDLYSVYRAKTSDVEWQNVLPVEIKNTIFSELNQTALEIFLN